VAVVVATDSQPMIDKISRALNKKVRIDDFNTVNWCFPTCILRQPRVL